MKVRRLFVPAANAMARLAGMKTWSELQAIFARTHGADDRQWNPKSAASLQLTEYRSWVYIAVNAIQNRFISIPFDIKRSDTDKSINPDNPAYETIWRPFNPPNKFMSFRRFKDYMILSYDLTGKAFALILRNRLGQPAGLWPLRPADFNRIIRGDTTTNYLKGFEFVHGVYSEEDIVYYYHMSPKDPLTSMSPIQALAYETDIDLYVSVYERDMLLKGAVPDFVLSTEKNLKPGHAEAVQDRWQQKYGGPSKERRVAIIDGGLTPKAIHISPKDLEMIEIAGWSKDKILAAYQVPPGKVGIVKDVNKANAMGIDITFNRECIKPRLKDFDEEITRAVLAEFDARLYMEHENPVPPDKEQETEEMFRMVSAGIISRNEARRLYYGLPGIGRGGDEIRVNMAEMVIGAAPAYTDEETITLAGPIEPEIVEPEQEPVKPYDQYTDVGHVETKAPAFPDPETSEGRDVIYERFRKNVDSQMEIWFPMLNRFFGAQRTEVLGRLRDKLENLTKLQSEMLYAKEMATLTWNSLVSKGAENRLSVFVEHDLKAIATTNGRVDMELHESLKRWMKKGRNLTKVLELLDAFYGLKTSSIVDDIVFDVETEAEKLGKEAEPIIKMLFKQGAQDGSAEVSHRYFNQSG